jgi:catechol 2,3-dioxygenase-like lactoylglutathione lyase family enzyme
MAGKVSALPDMMLSTDVRAQGPSTRGKQDVMECRIELIFVPVSDVDKAIDFYVEKLGFTLDMQAQVNDSVRFVQVTPPTSACSIAFGTGINDMVPGTQNSIQVVVPDAEAARQELVSRGVEASEVQVLEWGSFTSFSDPDGNTWTVQQLPARAG